MKCEKCGATNSENAVICRVCGRTLDSPEDGIPLLMRTCPHCGAKNVHMSGQCSDCGRELPTIRRRSMDTELNEAFQAPTTERDDPIQSIAVALERNAVATERIFLLMLISMILGIIGLILVMSRGGIV